MLDEHATILAPRNEGGWRDFQAVCAPSALGSRQVRGVEVTKRGVAGGIPPH